MSDGGGEFTFGTGVPLSAVMAGLAVLVTLAIAVFGHVRQHRMERNRAVEVALESLVAPVVIAARVKAVEVGRGELIWRDAMPLAGGDAETVRRADDEALRIVDELRASSLTLMWSVQAIEPRLRPFVRKRLRLSWWAPWVVRYEELHAPAAAALHAQLFDVMDDLCRALHLQGVWFDWRREGHLTNAALDVLPVMRSDRLRYASDDIRRLEVHEWSGDEDSILAEYFGQRVVSRSEREFRAALRRQEEEERARRDREWAEHRARWKPTVKAPRALRRQR